MTGLSDDLKEMGFVPTGEESPVDEDATLWTDGKELVCGKTGVVIDGNHHEPPDTKDVEMRRGRRIYRYQNSGRVKMPGGYTGSYDWGHSGDRFKY